MFTLSRKDWSLVLKHGKDLISNVFFKWKLDQRSFSQQKGPTTTVLEPYKNVVQIWGEKQKLILLKSRRQIHPAILKVEEAKSLTAVLSNFL
jgi:hypothetical protein